METRAAAIIPTMPELTDDQIQAIATEIAAGRTINAIKLYREFTGLGLAEAKAAIGRR